MEMILYDVGCGNFFASKLFFLNRIHIVFTHSQKLKLSDHLCTCVHTAQWWSGFIVIKLLIYIDINPRISLVSVVKKNSQWDFFYEVYTF